MIPVDTLSPTCMSSTEIQQIHKKYVKTPWNESRPSQVPATSRPRSPTRAPPDWATALGRTTQRSATRLLHRGSRPFERSMDNRKLSHQRTARVDVKRIVFLQTILIVHYNTSRIHVQSRAGFGPREPLR